MFVIAFDSTVPAEKASISMGLGAGEVDGDTQLSGTSGAIDR